MEDSHLKSLPWVEKYRPQNLDQITAQEESVRVLKHSLTSKNLPHLLFYGPPGTGKTSSILALAKELFTQEHYRNRVLELNASDERGISVIRDKVKHFARIALSNNVEGLPPYKLIILDEADSLTSDAQSALRRTMETFAKSTRFCLICNYVTRIIEPLASRCAKFRFKPIQQELCIDRISQICQLENVTYDQEAIELLVKVCNGDLRKGIMLTQSATQFKVDKHLNMATVCEISGIVPEELIEELTESIITNPYVSIMDQLTVTLNQGYSADALLNQLVDAILAMGDLSEIQKSKIALLAATCDRNLCDGGEEFLQLLAFVTQISQIVQGA